MDKTITNSILIRPIERKDNSQVQKIILEVMGEYACIGESFSSSDPEVLDMYEAYQGTRSAFYVISDNYKILGVGGLGPLKGGSSDTCEIRKMYFLNELRGKGFGRQLMDIILEKAKVLGYKKVYLETVERMERANKLYKAYGFKLLDSNQGDTGHCGCDSYYVKDI